MPSPSPAKLWTVLALGLTILTPFVGTDWTMAGCMSAALLSYGVSGFLAERRAAYEAR